MRIGNSGKEVIELQKRLSREGVYFSNFTGYFGNLTLNTVIKYQKIHNIPATGFVGPITRASLNGEELSNISTNFVNNKFPIITNKKSTTKYIEIFGPKISDQISDMVTNYLEEENIGFFKKVIRKIVQFFSN